MNTGDVGFLFRTVVSFRALWWAPGLFSSWVRVAHRCCPSLGIFSSACIMWFSHPLEFSYPTMLPGMALYSTRNYSVQELLTLWVVRFFRRLRLCWLKLARCYTVKQSSIFRFCCSFLTVTQSTVYLLMLPSHFVLRLTTADRSKGTFLTQNHQKNTF